MCTSITQPRAEQPLNFHAANFVWAPMLCMRLRLLCSKSHVSTVLQRCSICSHKHTALEFRVLVEHGEWAAVPGSGTEGPIAKLESSELGGILLQSEKLRQEEERSTATWMPWMVGRPGSKAGGQTQPRGHVVASPGSQRRGAGVGTTRSWSHRWDT
jgi:hypothetical protein